MAKSTLVIEDAEDGSISLNLVHDPPLTEEELPDGKGTFLKGTRAQDLAAHALKHVLVETGDM